MAAGPETYCWITLSSILLRLSASPIGLSRVGLGFEGKVEASMNLFILLWILGKFKVLRTPWVRLLLLARCCWELCLSLLLGAASSAPLSSSRTFDLTFEFLFLKAPPTLFPLPSCYPTPLLYCALPNLLEPPDGL